MRREESLVRDLLEQMHPDRPRTHGGLTLVPFFAALLAKGYSLAAEAFSLGLVSIEEIGGGPNITAGTRRSFRFLC
ncbi:MAG: hypothetical protein ABR529_06140 [Actinomycetota bacterium]